MTPESKKFLNSWSRWLSGHAEEEFTTEFHKLLVAERDRATVGMTAEIASLRKRSTDPMNPCDKPTPGQQYVHAKTGNRYTVLHVGVYCGEWDDGNDRNLPRGFPEGTELVVYVGHYDNKRPDGNRIYIRPVSEWNEIVSVPDHKTTVVSEAPRYYWVHS